MQSSGQVVNTSVGLSDKEIKVFAVCIFCGVCSFSLFVNLLLPDESGRSMYLNRSNLNTTMNEVCLIGSGNLHVRKNTSYMFIAVLMLTFLTSFITVMRSIINPKVITPF